MRTIAKSVLWIFAATLSCGGLETAWAIPIIEPDFTKPAAPGSPLKLSERVKKPGETFDFAVEPAGFPALINDTGFDILDLHLEIIKVKGSTDADWGDLDKDGKMHKAGGIFEESKVVGKTLTLFKGKIPKDGVFKSAFKVDPPLPGDFEFIEIRGSFSVPEPSTTILLGSALWLLLARRRTG